MEFISTPLAAAIVSGFVALAGALTSQLISARTALKTKQVELLYGKKSQAYQNYLIAGFRLLRSPDEQEHIQAYIESLSALKLVASVDVIFEIWYPGEGITGTSATIHQPYLNTIDNNLVEPGKGDLRYPTRESLWRLECIMRGELTSITKA